MLHGESLHNQIVIKLAALWGQALWLNDPVENYLETDPIENKHRKRLAYVKVTPHLSIGNDIGFENYMQVIQQDGESTVQRKNKRFKNNWSDWFGIRRLILIPKGWKMPLGVGSVAHITFTNTGIFSPKLPNWHWRKEQSLKPQCQWTREVPSTVTSPW